MVNADASALLALVFDEAGAGDVAEALENGALLSAINLAEVLGKVRQRDMDPPRCCTSCDARRSK